MLNNRPWNRRVGYLLTLSVLLLAGCSDTPERTSGKSLREATQNARQTYAKAHNQLTNPQIVGSEIVTESLDPAILDTLQAAEQQLKAAIAKFYGTGTQDKNVSRGDARTAKLMLGLITHVQGEYYYWSAGQALQKARQSDRQVNDRLDRVIAANTLQQTIRQSQQVDLSKLTEAIEKAQTTRRTLQERNETLTRAIEQRSTKIADLKQQIQQKNLQASKLKTESTMSTGQESLQQLQQALAMESEAHTLQAELQTLQNAQQRDRDDRQEVQARLERTAQSLQALQQQRQTYASNQQNAQAKLADARSELNRQVQTLQEEMTQLGQHCESALQQADQANTAFVQAGDILADAVRLSERDRQAEALAEQAETHTMAANLQLTLWQFRRKLESLTGRVSSVWDILGSEAPPRPTAPNVGEYLQASSDANQLAVARFESAVELLDKAISAAQRANRWLYQAEQAMVYLNYARALQMTQKDPASAYTSARQLMPAIEQGARSAGKEAEILDLKQAIQSSAP